VTGYSPIWVSEYSLNIPGRGALFLKGQIISSWGKTKASDGHGRASIQPPTCRRAVSHSGNKRRFCSSATGRERAQLEWWCVWAKAHLNLWGKGWVALAVIEAHALDARASGRNWSLSHRCQITHRAPNCLGG
jgi:hypothetical protein